jgi:dTDP-4-amino-4,6-dideoxygalactose transaminase
MSPAGTGRQAGAGAHRHACPRWWCRCTLPARAATWRRSTRSAREYGFRIIEDASHAVGGRYLGEPVGNCRYSDITVFSFHPVKIITTAEGGMALTNDAELAATAWRCCAATASRATRRRWRRSEGPWYYEQIALGYNYRMTDLQAALGASQRQRLEPTWRAAHEIAPLRRRCRPAAGTPVAEHPRRSSALHLYPIRVDARSPRRAGLRGAARRRHRRQRALHPGAHPALLPPPGLRRALRCPEAERYYAECHLAADVPDPDATPAGPRDAHARRGPGRLKRRQPRCAR